ncbi:MMPL family transporter [Nonomuraea sp. NPDC049309]|uniref:MMPL family transporter n=1 Tax=Nonomuraea sp. NPDC049309 TaxID=3364350 RepID=UPI0037177672
MRARTLAACVVLGWVVITLAAVLASGPLGDVRVTSGTSMLARGVESARVLDLVAEQSGRTVPTLVVYERPGPLRPDDLAAVRRDLREFARVPDVVGTSSAPLPSADRRALQVTVLLSGKPGVMISPLVEQVRRIAAEANPPGLASHVAGAGGVAADYSGAFLRVDGTLLALSMAVVLLVLLAVYRSPVLWLIPMLSVLVAYLCSAAAIYALARSGLITLRAATPEVFTVLVFGVATDYALLLIARFRERLRVTAGETAALKEAMAGGVHTVVASALTVAGGVGCLVAADTNALRSIGAAAAIGVLITMAVMVTLLPALMLLGGRRAFWPSVPHPGFGGPDGPVALGEPPGATRGLSLARFRRRGASVHPRRAWPSTGMAPDRVRPGTCAGPGRTWARVAGFVGRRAAVAWAGSLALLAVMCLGLTTLDASGIPPSAMFTTRTSSVEGDQALRRHYPASAPVVVLARQGSAAAVARAVRGAEGVVSVRKGPAAPWRVYDVVLAAEPNTPYAERLVEGLRAAVRAAAGDAALVGGVTGELLDAKNAALADARLVVPLILLVVGLILVVLLRSLVAPLLLMGTVVLSFAATLGVCSALFTQVLDHPVMDVSFALYAFVFLVAFGVDYNIFLMARVREETARLGTRQATLHALRATGGVITAAGVVLAAAFSVLTVLPLVPVVQLGLLVAVGVVIDTVLVRSFLVPALACHLGPHFWWPAREPHPAPVLRPAHEPAYAASAR